MQGILTPPTLKGPGLGGPTLWLPGQSRVASGPARPKGLRQSAIFLATGASYTLTLKKTTQAGSYLVFFVGINGTGHGGDGVSGGATEIAGQDVSSTSVDSLYLLAGSNTYTSFVFSATGGNASTILAGWFGEWTDLDQTNYGFGSVPYDRNFGTNGTAASASVPSPGGGNTNDFASEHILYCAMCSANVAPTFTIPGQTSEILDSVQNANGLFCVASVDTTAQSKFAPTYSFSGSTFYNIFVTSFKTL